MKRIDPDILRMGIVMFVIGFSIGIAFMLFAQILINMVLLH